MVLVGITILVALTLWGAAIWYAAVSPDVIVSRAAVIGVLVFGNIVAAFLYYWLMVHWRAGTRRMLGPLGQRSSSRAAAYEARAADGPEWERPPARAQRAPSALQNVGLCARGHNGRR